MMKKFVLALLAVSAMYSCTKEEGYDNFASRLGTIELTGDEGNDYRVILDDGNILIPFENSASKGNFEQHDRVLAFYSVVSRETDSDIINGAIHSLEDVLTKSISTITDEIQDSIGNNPIHVHEDDVWISNNYLNFYFSYLGYDKTHYINLVKHPNDSIDSDGRLFLEFRYNNNNDSPVYQYNGIVSFDLNSLPQFAADSVSFTVKINEFYEGEVYWNGVYYPGEEVIGLKNIDRQGFGYLEK